MNDYIVMMEVRLRREEIERKYRNREVVLDQPRHTGILDRVKHFFKAEHDDTPLETTSSDKLIADHRGA